MILKLNVGDYSTLLTQLSQVIILKDNQEIADSGIILFDNLGDPVLLLEYTEEIAEFIEMNSRSIFVQSEDPIDVEVKYSAEINSGYTAPDYISLKPID